MIHLYMNQCHDESEVWCNKDSYIHDGDPASDPDKASCEACLLAAFEYGLRAMRRRIFVKDGRVVTLHEQIDKMLHDLATPIMFVRAACPHHDPRVVERCVKCDPEARS